MRALCVHHPTQFDLLRLDKTLLESTERFIDTSLPTCAKTPYLELWPVPDCALELNYPKERPSIYCTLTYLFGWALLPNNKANQQLQILYSPSKSKYVQRIPLGKG